MKRSEVSELGEREHHGAGESSAGGTCGLRSESTKSPWEYAIVSEARRAERYSEYRRVGRTRDLLKFYKKVLKEHPDAIICVRDVGDKLHGHRVESLDALKPGGQYYHYTYYNRRAKKRRS